MFLFKEEFNMWNRSDLKSNAKLALKANYWKAVLVGLILSLILGSGSTATRNSAKSSTDGMAYMDPAVLFSCKSSPWTFRPAKSMQYLITYIPLFYAKKADSFCVYFIAEVISLISGLSVFHFGSTSFPCFIR